ncbi:MAG TPA: OmpA family protein [Xanthobacteraceae bacterium]|nr:OmpA family protein [Xanthobacteraceae bacterium]
MAKGNGRLISTWILGPALAAIVVLAAGAPAFSLSLEDQITAALRGSPARSLNERKTLEQKRVIDALRVRSTRSLTDDERDAVATLAEDKPHVDLEINFDYNSAEVGPKALPALLALGRALSKDEFKGKTFLINGHTDAKGGDEYNKALSDRRAEAVKRVLVEQFNLRADTLIAIGFGKTHLKNPADPLGRENRRVQIVNTEVN